MDNKDFENAKKVLLNINEVVAKMDPAVRVSTFDLLVSRFLEQPHIQPEPKSPITNQKAKVAAKIDTSTLGAFIHPRDTKKPVDALTVLVAWLYSQYGVYPISVKAINDLADSCGLTVPGRPDNTMRTAKNNSKSLFTQVGKGWQLTVSGELYLKETYKVSKGNRPLPKESPQE